MSKTHRKPDYSYCGRDADNSRLHYRPAVHKNGRDKIRYRNSKENRKEMRELLSQTE